MLRKVFKRKKSAVAKAEDLDIDSPRTFTGAPQQLYERSDPLPEVVEGVDWDAWNDAVSVQESQLGVLSEIQEFNSTFSDTAPIDTEATETLNGELSDSWNLGFSYGSVMLEIAAEERDRLHKLKYPKDSKPIQPAPTDPNAIDSWWGATDETRNG
jgi:hypothetical protein